MEAGQEPLESDGCSQAKHPTLRGWVPVCTPIPSSGLDGIQGRGTGIATRGGTGHRAQAPRHGGETGSRTKGEKGPSREGTGAHQDHGLDPVLDQELLQVAAGESVQALLT